MWCFVFFIVSLCFALICWRTEKKEVYAVWKVFGTVIWFFGLEWVLVEVLKWPHSKQLHSIYNNDYNVELEIAPNFEREPKKNSYELKKKEKGKNENSNEENESMDTAKRFTTQLILSIINVDLTLTFSLSLALHECQ